MSALSIRCGGFRTGDVYPIARKSANDLHPVATCYVNIVRLLKLSVARCSAKEQALI
jgi:hypothetical protein